MFWKKKENREEKNKQNFSYNCLICNTKVTGYKKEGYYPSYYPNCFKCDRLLDLSSIYNFDVKPKLKNDIYTLISLKDSYTNTEFIIIRDKILKKHKENLLKEKQEDINKLSKYLKR